MDGISCTHMYVNVNRYDGDNTWVCIHCNSVSVSKPLGEYIMLSPEDNEMEVSS